MDRRNKSEHMMDRIDDLALGEIHPEADLGLLAHLAECEACREAYNDAKTVCSLVDRGVEKLVTGGPSPQFNVRLGASLAREPVPARWNWILSPFLEPTARGSFSYVASTAVLIAIIVFTVMGLPRVHHSTLFVAAARTETPVASNSGVSFRQGKVNPERPPTKFSSHVISSDRVPREPEVLVPKEELRAVAQFYEATRNGHLDSVQLYAAQQQAQQPLELTPIEITPLEPIAAPLAPDPAGGPGLF